MKYKLELKGVTANDLFDIFIENFTMDYFASEGKKLSENKVVEGFTYEKNGSEKKGKVILGTVTVLKIQRPNFYSVEYKSSNSHTVTNYQFEDIGNDTVQIIAQQNREMAKKDDRTNELYFENKVDFFADEPVKNAGISQKIQWKYMRDKILARKKEEAKQQKVD